MEQKVNLKEYLHPEMDILFLSINAPEVSNQNAHWFSRNLSFWNLLYDASLITQRITCPLEGDEKVFGSADINFQNLIYGVTDLNRRDVETDSSKIETRTEDIMRIISILDSKKARKLCLMHSKVAEAFEKFEIINMNYRSPRYGITGKYNETIIYEVPFHNASIPNKHKYYNMLLEDNH